jgi:hypothetical protein
MPRTPAPLSVEQLRLRGRYAWWNLTDPDGNVVAEFREEADARAFVALPALVEALRTLIDDCTCECDHSDENCCAKVGVVCAKCIGEAALAQADGPAPTEEQ